METRKIRAKKIFITAINERNIDKLQFNMITFINSNDILINQYAKLFTNVELGDFDIIKDENDDNSAVLSFFPIDNRPNDYTYSFSLFNYFQDNPTEEFRNVFLGDLVNINSISFEKTENFSKIIELPSNFSSFKVQIQSSIENNYQYDEINLTHNIGIGTTTLSSVNYGTIFSGQLIQNSSVGLGTYFSYIENDKVYIDFIPNIDVDNNDKIYFNASLVSIANTNFSTEGTRNIGNTTLRSIKTFIPREEGLQEILPTVVGRHSPEYEMSYYVAQCTDLNTNNTQVSEIIVINSRTVSYIIEYGVTFTKNRLGTFSSLKTIDTELLFTPTENNNIEVVLYQLKISSFSTFSTSNRINLGNFEIESGSNKSGVDGDFAVDFELRHKQAPIFERLFDGSSSSIVNLEDNTIFLPRHFYVTGEKVTYISDEFDELNNLNSIKISPISVPGIGVTNILPTEVYVIKVDSTKIKLAKTAEDALKILPESFNFTELGFGDVHKIVSTKQNSKSLISIDNIIQSPVQSTNLTTTLTENINFGDFTIFVEDSKIFFFDDILKVGEEIMVVSSVGDGSIKVKRNRLGTNRLQHSIGSVVRKMRGNYNISSNRVYFTSPPYGLVPISSEFDKFDEVDYEGLKTKSTFDGRVFLRSGIPLSEDIAYKDNYIFDSLSEQFDGIESEFTLKQNNESITGISTNNAVVLINNIYQSPIYRDSESSIISGYYELEEETGETKIKFIGTPSDSNTTNINDISIPYGGVIVSVGSTSGFGYQPLVSAGGTAVVSSAGTITQISIGNSGSGYRSNLQTTVNVGIKTYSPGVPNIEIIGIASVVNGRVVGVSITNPGSGYSADTPPEVVFDAPLGYTDIPLIYSSESQSGIGTQSTIDIVVGENNNVIDFNIKNYGYGYKVGDILTIPVNSGLGIPTISNNESFLEFQIFVDQVYGVNFSGWSMGEFQVLDTLDSKFNGINKNFQISLGGEPISISKKKGSPIELEYVLLIFINDVLQIPFKNYTFNGSIIKFKSPPNGSVENPPYRGDTSKVIFYKGTPDIDVNFFEILDAPKPGDFLTINSDTRRLSQKPRIIEFVSTIDTADTNKYSDVGISQDENLLRPVLWCKQNDDLYISGREITKDRKIYSPYINPVSYLIKNIDESDTDIFVDSAKLIFDYSKENISINKSSIIEIISNTDVVGDFESITDVKDIDGDFGIIVGIGSTSIPEISNTCLVFDLFIPPDSYLRDSQLNSGISVEGISGIQTGYRFVVSGTSRGLPNISLDIDGNEINTGSTFLDNIYECVDFYTDVVEISGIGFTSVTKVVCPVNSYSGIDEFGEFYGKYSWGKISVPFRGTPKSFSISQSSINTNPIVRRKNPLKRDSYVL